MEAMDADDVLRSPVSVFPAGVVSQLATSRQRASRVLGLGAISMILGLVLLVVAVRLSTLSLAVFLIGVRLSAEVRARSSMEPL